MSPSGETALQALLAGMEPVLDDALYVFAVDVPEAQRAQLQPRMVFEEAEGTTLIVEKAQADAADITYAFACRRITLTVHSALEAVGFLARITRHLAANGISTNAVSAFYHDHLFVPESRADEAVALLEALAQSID